MRATDFSKYLTDYLSRYLPNERGLSFNTISVYRDTFVLLLTFIKENLHIKTEKLVLDDIKKETIINFLDWLQKERGSSNSTRNLRLSAIHSFYKYLHYQDLHSIYESQRILTIRKKKAYQESISYLSIEGITNLLAQPDTTKLKGIRDLALLSLMYDTGTRVSEIINLTPSMLRLQNPNTIKIIGKGNKARLVPMIDAQTLHLKNYIQAYNLDNSENRLRPLFFNSRKEKLTRAGINHILKKYIKLAKTNTKTIFPQKISCHSLRHSKAMHLVQAGVNLIYIRDLLGHVSIQTTEIYARIDSKHKREALEKAYVNLHPNQSEDPEWENNLDLISWIKKI